MHGKRSRMTNGSEIIRPKSSQSRLGDKSALKEGRSVPDDPDDAGAGHTGGGRRPTSGGPTAARRRLAAGREGGVEGVWVREWTGGAWGELRGEGGPVLFWSRHPTDG